MNPPGRLCSARGVRRQDLRHAAGEVLHRRQVQVLVGTVRDGVVAEQAGDHELRLREHVPEHLDERDAPALADGLEVVAEKGDGRLGQRGLEPGRERRRVPEPVVVPDFGTKTHRQAHVADAILELFDVLFETGAARLLGELDDDHVPRIRHPLIDEGADGREHREEGIVVVHPTTMVELVAVDDPQARHHLLAGRLLVAVTVQEHRAGLGLGARDLDENHRIETIDALDGDQHPRNLVNGHQVLEASQGVPEILRTINRRKIRRVSEDLRHTFHDFITPPPVDVGFRITQIELVQLRFPLLSKGSFQEPSVVHETSGIDVHSKLNLA